MDPSRLQLTMNQNKPKRTTTLHTTMNASPKFTRINNAEANNENVPILPSPTTQTPQSPSSYYDSSAFFAQTLDAAALHVKAEMAAEQRALRRRRRDSVHDGAFEEESIGGVGGLRGAAAFGRVGGLGGGR